MNKKPISKPLRKTNQKHPLQMSSEELEKFVEQVRQLPTRPLTAKDKAFVARIKGASSAKHIYLDEDTAARAIKGYIPERGRPRVGLGANELLLNCAASTRFSDPTTSCDHPKRSTMRCRRPGGAPRRVRPPSA